MLVEGSHAGTKSVGEISWCSVQPGHCRLDVEVMTRLPMHFVQTCLLQGVIVVLKGTLVWVVDCCMFTNACYCANLYLRRKI